MSFAKQVAFKLSRAIAGRHPRRQPHWTDLFDQAPKQTPADADAETADLARVTRLIVALVLALNVLVLSAGYYRETIAPPRSNEEWSFASPTGRPAAEIDRANRKAAEDFKAMVAEARRQGWGSKTTSAEKPDNR